MVMAKDYISVIDHTFLKTEKEGLSVREQEEHVRKLVSEAHHYGAYAVCVREDRVAYAKRLISDLGSSVKIVSVIGFPCGDEYSSEEKCDRLFEAKTNGADEFDMVMNYGSLKAQDLDDVYEDLLQVSLCAEGRILKVIFETCYLSEREKEVAGEIAYKAFEDSCGADFPQLMPRFFKTSTGFGRPSAGIPVGATLSDVRLLTEMAQGRIGVKAAGGISTLAETEAFFAAAGSPLIQGRPDPLRFRIGSSSLLSVLVGKLETVGPTSY